MDQITGMGTHNRHPQNPVFSGDGQHLDKSVGFGVGNGPVQAVNVVTGNLIRDIVGQAIGFVLPHPGYFGIGKGGPGNHPVVGLEFFKAAEQGVYTSIPGLMGGHMGELIRPCHITGGINIGN